MIRGSPRRLYAFSVRVLTCACVLPDSQSLEGGTVGRGRAVLLGGARSSHHLHHQTTGRTTGSHSERLKANSLNSVDIMCHIVGL